MRCFILSTTGDLVLKAASHCHKRFMMVSQCSHKSTFSGKTLSRTWQFFLAISCVKSCLQPFVWQKFSYSPFSRTFCQGEQPRRRVPPRRGAQAAQAATRCLYRTLAQPLSAPVYCDRQPTEAQMARDMCEGAVYFNGVWCLIMIDDLLDCQILVFLRFQFLSLSFEFLDLSFEFLSYSFEVEFVCAF